MDKNETKIKLNRDIKAILDALFYITSRPINIQSIMRLLNIKHKDSAKKIMDEYIYDFNNRMYGIKILKKRDYYVPSIKDEYVEKLRGYMRPPPLTQKQLETLAYIYVKKKVKLRDLKDIFGNRVYSDIKKFIKLGLVNKKSTNEGYVIEIREEAEPLIRGKRRHIYIQRKSLE